MYHRCGLLVISHDEHLVTSICEELWVAEPGKVSIYRDSFESYRKKQLPATKKAAASAKPGARRVVGGGAGAGGS